MKKINSSTNNISFIISFITLVGMVLYFAIMSVSGMVYQTGFRALNIVFVAAGLFWLMHEFKKEEGTKFHYFQGAIKGISFTFQVMLVYSVFIWMALRYLNPELMTEISEASLLEGHMTPVIASLVVFIEGMASGLLITFASLQWYKRPIKEFRSTANRLKSSSQSS